MTWNREPNDRAKEPEMMEELDPVLKQALGDFKKNVHAWSDAVYAQPRVVRSSMPSRSWRLAANWSLAAMLVAGVTSGGVYVHHERVVADQLAAQRVAEQQRQEAIAHAQKQAQEEEEMLASVETAVSREVPTAMEPLAQLSEESASQ
jgi:hypothetical protein